MNVVCLIIEVAVRLAILLTMHWVLQCSIRDIRDDTVPRLHKVMLGVMAVCSAIVIILYIAMGVR